MDGWTIGRLKTYTAYKEESELKSGLFSSKTINCHYSIFNPARLDIRYEKRKIHDTKNITTEHVYL